MHPDEIFVEVICKFLEAALVVRAAALNMVPVSKYWNKI
jgi:hypothetical protein